MAGKKRSRRRGEYGWSVNLPRTEFPLRASQRAEREALKHWQAIDLYGQVSGGDRPPFVLHDGPPFSDGDIHLGQALNKLLKDFVLKFKGMQGYATPCIPGWDMHGLPPEIAVIRRIGPEKATASPREVRRRCAVRARQAMARQRAQCIRLGVRADWEAPYLTLQPSYEGAVLRTFQTLVERDLIARAPKPVRWCPACQAALSDAEVEAHPQVMPAVHVALPALHVPHWLFPGEDRGRMAAAVWTTAPWTLLAAVAVALHPETNYALVTDRGDPEGFTYLVARERVRTFGHAARMKEPYVLGQALGKELAPLVLLNPLTGRELPVLLSARVRMEPGSGIDAVRPGADADDYTLAQGRELPVLPVVDAQGRLAPRTGPFAGLTLEDGQRAVLRQLDQDGVLLSYSQQEAPVEHCWRCRGPLITRAVPHWFLRVESVRERLLAMTEAITWHPAWGRAQMAALLTARPDWCLSRQRTWGVPIPALLCTGCEEPLLTPALVARAAEIISAEGADAWWVQPTRAFLPDGTACPHCGGTAFRKATDIFDVWFESACSPPALAAQRPELPWPADLVLEGHDQYRGWFGLALLVAAATEQPMPFRTAVSHGFVLDAEDGRKVTAHGPGPDPRAVVQAHGAEVLRWWAALTDTRGDMTLTPANLTRAAQVYGRVRAAIRYLLGNLFDFLPEEMRQPEEALEEADRWVLGQLNALITRVTAAFETYRFHLAAHAIVEFCALLTARYLPVARDRLYLLPPDDPARRSAQTACYTLVETLTRLLAPLLSFTAEEIWRHLPAATRPASPQLASWPTPDHARDDADAAARWRQVWAARRTVQAALASARRESWISTPERAKVTIYLAGEYERLRELTPDTLETAFGVAAVELVSRDDAPATAAGNREETLAVTVAPAAGACCPRCRRWRPLGRDAAFPALCAPCAAAVGAPSSVHTSAA